MWQGEFPILETERLLLRKITLDDVEDIFAYASNPEVSHYVTWDTHQTIASTKAFVTFILKKYENKELAPWGIEYKEKRKLIGTIDFVSWNQCCKVAEIGYAISSDYWGQGLTTEAANKVVQYGFEHMNLIRIEARCLVENIGSQRVMEKLGMSLEQINSKEIVVKGQFHDLKRYAISKEKFVVKEEQVK